MKKDEQVWLQVYVAKIRAGFPAGAKEMADQAVKEFNETFNKK